jgi:hypothetical protein
MTFGDNLCSSTGFLGGNAHSVGVSTASLRKFLGTNGLLELGK